MGLFDKILGGKKDYPELDPASPITRQLERVQGQLEELSGQVNKPLEVLPGETEAYVFIGKPPKEFGVAWIEGGRIASFKTVADERGIDPKRFVPLAEQLRQIYEQNRDDPRYTAKVGEHKVVVTPSDAFRQQVAEVIRKATH